MRISDWSSDVCSSDLHVDSHTVNGDRPMGGIMTVIQYEEIDAKKQDFYEWKDKKIVPDFYYEESMKKPYGMHDAARSEEHTSELQSPMRISFAVFCLKKKTATSQTHNSPQCILYSHVYTTIHE